MRRAIVLLTVIIVLGGLAIAAREFGNAPVDRRDTAAVTVGIPEGSSTRRIARTLAGAGVLRSEFGFLALVSLNGRPALQAGTYTFTKAESGREILDRLRGGDANARDIAVTIPEGFTLQNIAARLEQNKVVTAQAFRDAATVQRFRREFAFLNNVPDGTLEGYLFPDTYRFLPGTRPDDVVRKFLRRFDEQFTAVVRDTTGLGDRSIHEVVTMASIVEGEVRSYEDRRLVAGILWNRFLHNVGLGADATVRYAINVWDRPLTVQDIAVDSPYNTRRFAGLPPGPIGSPGRDSLRATLDPQDSDYFYYLSAKDDRATIFSKTLEEHNAAIQKHLR